MKNENKGNSFKLLLNSKLHHIESMVKINLCSNFLCCQSVVGYKKKNHLDKSLIAKGRSKLLHWSVPLGNYKQMY